jgi:precorrin-6B methylase 2
MRQLSGRLCFFGFAAALLAWQLLGQTLLRAQAPVPAAQAQTADEKIPPPLKEYKGRTIAPFMTYHGADWLIRETREREEACSKLLNILILNVQPGQCICDMGCGNGFYSIQLAKLVGEKGRILAVDIQPQMLSLLKQRCQKEKVGNVEPVLGTVIDPKLPDESIDLMLMVDVYHEFSHPEHMLRAIRKALKPSGRMVLVEFRLEDPNVPIKLLHKMSKAQILKEIPPNGFQLAGENDDLPWQHVMFFARDDAKLDDKPKAAP